MRYCLKAAIIQTIQVLFASLFLLLFKVAILHDFKMVPLLLEH